VETTVVLSALLADSFLSGWVVLLIFAVLLIFFSAGNLPGVRRRLRQRFHEIPEAAKDTAEELGRHPDENALVYEALTHDNRSAEFIYPHRSNLSELLRAMILFVAQGFGVGRIYFAPGTFGSLVGLVWFAALMATKRYELYLLGALCGLGLSVWLCGAAEKILKQRDPPSVVLDEIIAMPFCFLPWVTHTWLAQSKLPALDTFLTGQGLLVTVGVFILFRAFDIFKPWPVRQSQRLPGGWGVTVDDLLAAAYVGLLTLVFLLVRQR
jgi:phosphatidylglycerophosphatase A